MQGPQAILQALHEFGGSSLSVFWNLFSFFGLSGFRKFKGAVTKSGARAKERSPAYTLSFKDCLINLYIQMDGKVN